MGDALAEREGTEMELGTLDDDEVVIMRPAIERERAARYFFCSNLLGHALISPLDEVTDIGLVQGIVDRWFGLWRVSVQTASSGQAAPEAMLVGLRDPEEFRRRVLAQRERWLESGDLPAVGAAPDVRVLSPAPEGLAGDRVERPLEKIERLLAKIADNTQR